MCKASVGPRMIFRSKRIGIIREHKAKCTSVAQASRDHIDRTRKQIEVRSSPVGITAGAWHAGEHWVAEDHETHAPFAVGGLAFSKRFGSGSPAGM